MSHQTIARVLLAVLCGSQGLGTLAIDLNRTHATNSAWTRHARFHLVWQAASYALLSILEIALILVPGPYSMERFYFAAILAAIPMFSCLLAFSFRGLYGGALSDPNGIPPFKATFFRTTWHVDLNLTAEIFAIMILIGIVAIFAH